MIPFTKYVTEKFLTYQIEVSNVATVYIACYKDPNNINNNIPVQDGNLAKTDPTELALSLKNNFAYGGSRLAKYLDNKEEATKRAIKSVNFLAIAESHMKHAVINKAIEDGALNNLIDR